MALVLSEMRLLLGAAVVLHSVLSWPSIAVRYTDVHPWILGRIPFRQALRLESEDSWLSRKHPEYQIVKLFRKEVPENARVLAMAGVPESYIRPDVLVSYQSATGEKLADIFFAAFTADYQPRSAEWVRFAPRQVRKIRVYQTREWKMEWTIAEMRIYSGGHELPRRPEWRLTANPNPWDIQLAFDNLPVTRWRCGELARPGMWVEVDFGGPQTVDAVELESPTDSGGRDLRVEGADAAGHWSVLSDKRTIEWLSPPQFMGRGAVRELKWRGIDYLFLREGRYGYPEVAENPDAWGLTEVGSANGGHLYRLDAGLPLFEAPQAGTLRRAREVSGIFAVGQARSVRQALSPMPLSFPNLEKARSPQWGRHFACGGLVARQGGLKSPADSSPPHTSSKTKWHWALNSPFTRLEPAFPARPSGSSQ